MPVSSVAWCVAFLTTIIILLFQSGKVAARIPKKFVKGERLFVLSYCSFCFGDLGCSLPSELLRPFHNPLTSPNSSYFAKLSA